MWSLNDQCYSSAWPDDRETYSLVVESCLVGKVDFTSKSSSWMRKEEFFQSGKAKRTSKTRSRSNCSKEGANQKERHKRKASDVQVASFVSAERSLCCWSQTPPLRSRCHHLLQPMLPFPRIPDRWENINLRRILLLALAQPWLPLPDSTHFSILELPLQLCQTWIWIQLDLSPCSSLVVLCHPSLQRILSNTCAFGFWSKRVLFSKERSILEWERTSVKPSSELSVMEEFSLLMGKVTSFYRSK